MSHNGESYVALRLHVLAQITGNMAKESELRAKLKQLYKNSYRGLQYFLDPESSLQVSYPVRSKEQNNTKSCKCVFIAHKDLHNDTLQRLIDGNVT